MQLRYEEPTPLGGQMIETIASLAESYGTNAPIAARAALIFARDAGREDDARFWDRVLSVLEANPPENF